mmetsp:Transcript_39470/g.39020  ORF Transcript_39470/g.39020 Transcript_39470/m.39020 type:complete len:145 (+) Transcript_39470:994-1428(+)
MELDYKGGNFIIKDLKSKFGTLVLSQKPIKIEKGSHSTIQVGRTVLSFTVRKNSHFGLPEFGTKSVKFQDVKTFFERDFHIPYFGLPAGHENINFAQEDHVNNIPQFKIHSSTAVMKGNLLPIEEYQVDLDRLQEQEDGRRDHL